MQVEAIGRGEPISSLQPGQCCFFDSSRGLQFGMLTQDGNQKALLVFAQADDGRSPWVITGGLPTNVLVINDVQVRTDWKSAALGAAMELGQITSSAGSFYMRAALRRVETVTINVGSGMLEDPAPLGAIFHYTRWSVGFVRDGKWLSIVDFPFATGSST